MRLPTFRAIYLGVLFPALVYVLVIPALEAYLKARWAGQLRDALIPDVEALLRGQERIEDAVHRGIKGFLTSQPLVRLGAKPIIVVRTGEGRLLYPPHSWSLRDDSQGGFLTESGFHELQDNASYNTRVMREGISLSLDVRIPAHTWLASGILLVSVLISCGFLYVGYRIAVRRSLQEHERYQESLRRASEELAATLNRLRELEEREGSFRAQIAFLQGDLDALRHRIRVTEEEALREMEELEAKLRETIVEREALLEEVERLRGEMAQMEHALSTKSTRRESQAEGTKKRFSALYKRVIVEPRAIEGILSLPKPMQIKAEQTIQNLDRDWALVPVRRKVFSGKGGAPVLETEFAHRGRLYWVRTQEGRLIVLAVGTKNTQERDLAFLRNLEL